MHDYTLTLSDWRQRIGARIELHPANTRWAMGARYGTVVSVGRTYVRVALDKLTARTFSMLPRDIRPLEEE